MEAIARAHREVGPVESETSTGGVQIYARVGEFGFRVEDQSARLTIFVGLIGLFLPFFDAFSGAQAYPAGRYPVDFYITHQPYCAYSENWSCPFTSIENRIRVPIQAGERTFFDPG